MNEERNGNHVYEKALKIFYIRTNYLPGPIMEEKIISTIRRKKRRTAFYRVSLVFLAISIVVLLGPSKLREPLLELTERLNPPSFQRVSEQIHSENPKGSRGSESRETVRDPVFEMLKFLSVANDGDWNGEWGDEGW